jgi:hypothetical protein
MVKGFPPFKKEIVKCESYIIGKQKRDYFITSTQRAKKCLQLMYSNICGSMETSLGGYIYFIIFNDDFTMESWVYFFKAKSKAFKKFIHFQFLVENATKGKIETLRDREWG